MRNGGIRYFLRNSESNNILYNTPAKDAITSLTGVFILFGSQYRLTFCFRNRTYNDITSNKNLIKEYDTQIR